jgi:hypothetical protein
MGSFYGSVHLRTTDRQAVHKILDELARKRQARFLLGPSCDGWLAVYPDNHGQDEAVVKAIAKRFSGEMLHVLVHDDDIFAYSFFQGGKRVDHYNSRPDYFGKVSARARQQCRGQPELLAHLLADRGALPELQELLSQGRDAPPVFATGTLERFVELFRLRNAVSSYEYLMRGDRDDIEGWDQFIHVPDRSAEIARQQQADQALAQAKQKLQAAGLLLVEQTGGDPLMMAAWCPDREGSGFLVAWINLGGQPGPFPVQRLGPPWSNPTTTGLTVTHNDRWLALSPSGRYLALGGFQRTILWDLDSKTMLLEVPCQRMVSWLGFSPDDKHLLTVAPEEIVVSAVEGGRQLNSFVVAQANLAAIHPTGQLVIADNLGQLSIVDYLSGKVLKTMFLGGRHVPSAMEIRLLKEYGQQVDAQAVMANVRAAMEQQLKTMEKRQSKEAIEQVRAEMEKQLATMQKQLEQQQQNPASRMPPVRGKEQVYQLLISDDGQWFFCTSSGGVRACAWNDLAAGNDARAIHFLQPQAMEHKTTHGTFNLPGYYYGVAHDARANRLIYAGGTGFVHALDLAGGRSAVLLDPPDRPPIHRLGLSRDGSSLCCICAGKVVEQEGRNSPSVLQIWNYRDLAAKLDSRVAE